MKSFEDDFPFSKGVICDRSLEGIKSCFISNSGRFTIFKLLILRDSYGFSLCPEQISDHPSADKGIVRSVLARPCLKIPWIFHNTCSTL